MTDDVHGVQHRAEPPVEARRDPFPFLLALTALVGLAIRVTFVAVKQVHTRLAGDAAYYYLQAKLVANGHGFLQPFLYLQNHQSVPAADHPPGFVGLLVVANKLGLKSQMDQRYFMCVVGTATIVVVGLLGKRIAGSRFGLIAALLCAVYPQIWINDGMLMSETLYVFSLVCALYMVYRTWERPTWTSVLLAALALSVASFTRPESVLLFVLLLVPVVLRRRQLSWGRRIGMLGASAALAAVLFAPWVAYNMNRFSKPVYLSTGFGQTLLAANCDATYSGQFLGWYSGACIAPDLIAHPPTGDPSANDIYFRKEAETYMRSHKRELPKVVMAREGRMWGVWRPHQMVLLDGWIEGRGSVTISLWAQRAYWLMGSLAILGLFAWRRLRVPIYPLLVQFGLTAFIAAMTFGVTRYRAGAEIAIVLLATASIEWVVVRLRGGPPTNSPEPNSREAAPAHVI